MKDTKSIGRDEPNDLSKGGTDDGRKTKQEKQMRNSECKESQKSEKQLEQSYRHRNNPHRYHDKEPRDNCRRSGSPSSELHPSM